MPLSISNLAFKQTPMKDVLPQCAQQGILGLEIAPGIIWGDPIGSTLDQRKDLRRQVEENGLNIVALQSVLFGKADLQLFGSPAARDGLREYLEIVIEHCHDLGAGILSFGVYRNRIKGGMDISEAMDIASEFFHGLAEDAAQLGVVICFEPLSVEYGCDFIHNAAEGAELVERVGHDHFRLLYDIGNAMLDGLKPEEEIVKHAPVIHHVHLNRPKLLPPGWEEQAGIRKALEQAGYGGFITLEFLSEKLDLLGELRSVLEIYR